MTSTDAQDTSATDVAETPNEAADSHSTVSTAVPSDILSSFDVYSYRNAATILSQSFTHEFQEILSALRHLQITTDMIRRPGGNESEIPKIVTSQLRPAGWFETTIRGDLLITVEWKEETTTQSSKKKMSRRQRKLTRSGHLDGHKIDYVKGKVAFDFEWNSKDQTFDRDLYAFSTFFQSGIIDVGVLVTRSAALTPVFQQLGPALTKTGEVLQDSRGNPRMTADKYGASTTWMGKLLYRLNAGRNQGCPVLVIGIRPECIKDWTDTDEN